MSKLNLVETGIENLVILEPRVFGDERGYFMETYNKREFEEIGIKVNFVQDNHSKSKKGVLRGLHFQTKFTQGKLVRVIKGSVWDVAVDLRSESPTFGKWYALELSEKNKKMFFIPEGFAHGFLTLEDETEFQYKCTNLYYPEYDSGIIWNDKELNIQWPFEKYGLKKEDIVISEKDTKQNIFIKETKYF